MQQELRQPSTPLRLQAALAEARRQSEIALADTVLMPPPVISGFFTSPIDGAQCLAVNNPFERMLVLVEASVEQFYACSGHEPVVILLKATRVNEVVPFRFYYTRRGRRIDYSLEETQSFDVCVKGAAHVDTK
jgi:hypothetical protein